MTTRQPQAILALTRTGDGSNSIIADGSGSFARQGTLRKYRLSWGDGEVSADGGAPPNDLEHTYATPGGPRTVSLYIEDNRGRSATTQATIELAVPVPVENLPPVARLTVFSGAALSDIWNFSTLGTFDPDDAIRNYTIDYGDGSTPISVDGVPPLNLYHTFLSTGPFPVTFSVTDSRGKTATFGLQVTVIADPIVPDPTPIPENQGPTVGLQLVTDGQFAGQPFAFAPTADTGDLDGVIVNWVFDYEGAPAQVFAALPAIGAATILVNNGGDLQAAFNAAASGDVIALEAGATFIGNFTLPAKGNANYIIITSQSAIPDRRMLKTDVGTLPIIRSANSSPAIATAAGAQKYRLAGLEIAANGSTAGTSILIGDPLATTLAGLATDIVLDRLLVHGDATVGQKRGLSLHPIGVRVDRCCIWDFKLPGGTGGQDSQAIWGNNGPGPYTIIDSYVEGAAENILFGGDDPRIPNLIPSDIWIEGNTIAKPLAWQQLNWQVKNLVEFKNARRFTLRGNALDGCWSDAQTGYAILLTPRNQGGTAPWCGLSDGVIEYNVVTNVSSGISMAGDDDLQTSARTTGIKIRYNRFTCSQALYGGDGIFMKIGRAPQAVTVDNNTAICDGDKWIYSFTGGAVTTSLNCAFRNNLALVRNYGFLGVGTTQGTPTMTMYYPGGIFTGNVLGGGNAAIYPAGNSFPTVTAFQAAFTDYAGGDYRLAGGSAYASIGYDFAGLGVPPSSFPITPSYAATFTATLACTDDDGKVGSASTQFVAQAVPAANQPPRVTFARLGGSYAGNTFSFSITAQDPDGAIRSVRVIWGDGTPDGTWTTAVPSSITHIYTQPGVYTARATAIDSNGVSSPEVSVVVSVLTPPVVGTGRNANFNAIAQRSDVYRLYSLRDQTQLELYKSARSWPADVNYLYPNDPDPRRQDAAKGVIPATNNSLPNQVWLPFGADAGNNYFVQWDAWYGDECRDLFTALSNWKAYQFDYPRTTGGKATIWMEVQHRFDLAPVADLAAVRARQYATDPKPSGVTAYDPVAPVAGSFNLKTEVWSRFSAYIEMPAFGEDDVRLTLWASDVNRAAVKLLDRTRWKREVSGRIERFWVEMNTSTDAVAVGRLPLVFYVSNVAMLKGTSAADAATLAAVQPVA